MVPSLTFAGGATGGAIEPTQILNNIELIGVNISDASTALSTNLDMVKNTILDPIANGLITNAMEQATDDILSWANGGFDGEQPLIVSNPEKYIKNKGASEAKRALKGIPEDSIFGNSIFSSLANQYAYDSKEVEEKLEDLSKSDSLFSEEEILSLK